MAAETILQHWIFSRFALPFLLVFLIIFALLEKTKLLGSDKKQINALVAFSISLIFVAFVFPVTVVNNLVLVLTVAMVTVFVGLLLWGFIIGGEAKVDDKTIKVIFGVIIVIFVIGAVLWATGFYTPIWDWLFEQDWSGTFWTNFAFIVAIAVALAVVLKGGAGGTKA